ncbi:hypothetical protein LSTR_LSTR009357 [Laodelphax striatellus]|uniref:Uncharacterized protein n=1 Tax=Laodelphax striatellus TaxID=195883 RepID=A0A482WP07_LAOST|nr:hypothetical protein LSTR_LSTR009357 [Laodelphax striatellus]
MEYASVDELRRSVMQVSDFRGGLNQAKIISHSDESRSRPDHGVNEESMQDFRRYLRMDEDFIPRPSYHNYEYGHRRPSSMGRGKLLRQAAEMSGNYNLQSIRDRKVKQQMYEVI